MGKYFGTDGFRGEANKVLLPIHVYKIGFFLANHYKNDTEHARILIGKDTRLSGYMLESALCAGITAAGGYAYTLGVTTTPSVSYLTRTDSFSCGIMISASHNPYTDNGIKVLNANGEKLEEEIEAAIEAFIDGDESGIKSAHGDFIGRVFAYGEARNRYADYLGGLVQTPFNGMKIALDCANGSAHKLAQRVFEEAGAEVIAIHNNPDGININVACGSTHPESLQSFVVENGCACGFAYDGDADRCLAVDENGKLVTGDEIMYVCGKYMQKHGELANDTIVTTVMSNFGLYKSLDALGIRYEKTNVGDKYVSQNMRENGHNFGGEQSGHIIFGDHAVTGDGIMTSLMVMNAILDAKETLGELCSECIILPQCLKNVRVDDKAATLADKSIESSIAKAEEFLGSEGRILVRQSGTEPVIRVMAEGPTLDVCELCVDGIVDTIKKTGHCA